MTKVHSSCSTCTCIPVPKWQKFEYDHRDSYKFWYIKREDNKVWTHFGRIGTSGSKLLKEFVWKWEAMEYVDRMINEKLNKGYYKIS